MSKISTRRRAASAAVLVAFAATLASCDSGSFNDPTASVADGEVEMVRISPEEIHFTAPGQTLRVTATALDASGRAVEDVRFEWAASRPDIATVDSMGNVTAKAAGTASVVATALCCLVSDVAAVDVDQGTPVTTPPASTTAPAPESGDRVMLDTRAGGAQDIQVDGLSERLALAPLPDRSANVSFAQDFDGAGTAAFRYKYPGLDGACKDVSNLSIFYLPNPYPDEMYVSWKMWMGRTAADDAGIGDVGYFDVTSDLCTGDGAGRKIMRFLRAVPDGGASWSFDLLWGGPSPGANPFFGYWKHEGDTNGTRRTAHYQPEDHYNQVMTHTVYMKAASSDAANDGILRLWVNGELVNEWTDIPMGEMPFHRFQWPMVIRGPVKDMTEYWWDIVAWQPTG